MDIYTEIDKDFVIDALINDQDVIGVLLEDGEKVKRGVYDLSETTVRVIRDLFLEEDIAKFYVKESEVKNEV